MMRDINCSNATPKMGQAYKLFSEVTKGECVKREVLESIYDEIKQSPLTTEDEKWIATMARKNIDSDAVATPWDHRLKDREAVKVGEIFLEECFTPEAQKEPVEKNVIDATYRSVQSVETPYSQIKIFDNFYSGTKYGVNHKSPSFNLMLEFIKSISHDAYGHVNINENDAVKIGLLALEHMTMAGPYSEITSKFFSAALNAVESKKAKEWLNDAKEYCASKGSAGGKEILLPSPKKSPEAMKKATLWDDIDY